jgi:hypothetical protein
MTTLAITGNAHAPIEKKDVKVSTNPARPAQFTDDGALKLVVQDAARFEMWLDSKQWTLNWRETDILYQSPRSISAFDGTNVTRANVSRFTVAKHVNSLVPTMMGGIFYDSPPFVLRPRSGTSQQTTREKTTLFAALLDDIDFKAEVERGMDSQCLNGTGIWKYGWTVTRTTKKVYVRKQAPVTVNLPFSGPAEVPTEESDEFEVKEIEVTKSRPFFEHCPLGTVLVDPGWRHGNQIWRSKAVIHRQYLSFNDLDQLRNQDGYNIPPTEELKALFFAPVEIAIAPGGVEQSQQANATIHHAEGRDQKTTEDPLELPLKVDERWDGSRVITVIQDKLIIRNELHGFGQPTFLSANWWNIQNAGYGLGIGRLIGADQRVEAGAMNAALDILSFGVNPQYARSRGANAPTQQIRQRLGGIIDVDGKVGEAFALVDTPKVPAEVWQVIQTTRQAAESTSGADEAFSQGAMPQRGSSIGRTATGAGNIAAAQATRIQGPLGRFIDNVFIPFLVALDEMIRERMPIKEIRDILSDELGDDYRVDMEKFLNGNFKFEVLAGAHLAAKKAMAQSLPIIINLFENPQLVNQLKETGWVVDVQELFSMMMEMSEWKNTRNVIRKMTDEEKKMYMQAQQASVQQQKTEADIKKIAAKHEATSAEIDQKAEAQLASKLSVQAQEHAAAFVERQQVEHSLQSRGVAPAEPGQFHTTATGS